MGALCSSANLLDPVSYGKPFRHFFKKHVI
jgi:hypothetical protein